MHAGAEQSRVEIGSGQIKCRIRNS